MKKIILITIIAFYSLTVYAKTAQFTIDNNTGQCLIRISHYTTVNPNTNYISESTYSDYHPNTISYPVVLETEKVHACFPTSTIKLFDYANVNRIYALISGGVANVVATSTLADLVYTVHVRVNCPHRYKEYVATINNRFLASTLYSFNTMTSSIDADADPDLEISLGWYTGSTSSDHAAATIRMCLQEKTRQTKC